jgi:hypothetical protein
MKIRQDLQPELALSYCLRALLSRRHDYEYDRAAS